MPGMEATNDYQQIKSAQQSSIFSKSQVTLCVICKNISMQRLKLSKIVVHLL